MTDDADSVHAEQGTAAIGFVISSFFGRFKSFFGD
jgi:hypothetical protein